MQNPLILIFAVLTLVVSQRSVESALLDVFLPVLLLVPATFILLIPHLPPTTCIGAVLLPLGIVAIVTRSQRWRFRRADLWVIIFVLASGYTDYINNGLLTALDSLPSMIGSALFPYILGKLLLEQGGIREQFIRRMALLISAAGFISIAEFLFRKNLYLMVASRLLSAETTGAYAIRGRFTRVAGPFAGAEQAGILFMMGFFVSLWLWFLNRSRQNESEPKYFGLRRSTLFICADLLGLYMTLSRGPWMGTAAGFLIAQIGLAKNRRRAMILALILGTAGGIFANSKAKQYSQANENSSEQERTAEYRTHLFDIYGPVAEKGGLFGWSATSYPREPGYGSIDNQYLLLWVTNGEIGLAMFVLIAAEGLLAIALAIRRSRQRIDSCFYYCLAGMLIGLMLVLITVWLVAQGLVLFFLFVGWSQSLRDQYGEAKALPQKSASRFSFRRVFA